MDHALIRRLGLPSGVARTHVGFMGCHGLLNGLRVARAFVEADPSACVLLCAVELCSLHFQYGWDPERMVANALFADGAAAMVILAGAACAPTRRRITVLADGSTLLPDCEDAMSWRIGDHGFTMTLSPRVPELIGRARAALALGLAGAGTATRSSRSARGRSIPGGPRILSVFGEAAGLDRSALSPSFGVLADYGNMSSPTVAIHPPAPAARPVRRGRASRSGSGRASPSRRPCWAEMPCDGVLAIPIPADSAQDRARSRPGRNERPPPRGWGSSQSTRRLSSRRRRGLGAISAAAASSAAAAHHPAAASSCRPSSRPSCPRSPSPGSSSASCLDSSISCL